MTAYREAVVAWPALRWHLSLTYWKQKSDPNNSDVNGAANNCMQQSQWCDVVLLILNACDISDFAFVNPLRLERFAFYGRGFRCIDPKLPNSVVRMLTSCASLVSLTFDACVKAGDDVAWMVDLIARLTHLLHFSLCENYLGPEKMKRICSVLCRMPHITSLNFAGNNLGSEGTKVVCECVSDLPDLKILNLASNEIGAGETKYVCSALANKHCIMTHLSLVGNELKSSGVRELVSSCLVKLPNLVYLHVGSNDGDEATKEFVRAQLAHVKELNV
eukprot:c9736_g1_i1.p1 GENE.c9736_g1_i1~~c9736_g1_i1.p1  ORF type:complete len:293 (-),score=67.73 c9736_g1_i1:143-967(-)